MRISDWSSDVCSSDLPAWKFWQDEGRASGMTFDEFKESFSKYQEYHANIGAPGRIEGAAGSLYVEVPGQVYGRLNTGEAFNMLGSVQLSRVNDVPGSTPEQRKWHIAASTVKPTPHTTTKHPWDQGHIITRRR